MNNQLNITTASGRRQNYNYFFMECDNDYEDFSDLLIVGVKKWLN